MEQGVYKITNKINNKLYIGSTSVNLFKRKNQHFRALRLNKHYNQHLQSSYNKYREENFIFEVIEYCEKDKCVEREQYWINFYNSTDKEMGYNICYLANSTLGTKRTLEQCQNISNSLKGKLAKEKHPMWGKKRKPTMLGKKHTEESLEKMKNFQRNRKMSDKQIENLNKLLENQKGESHPRYGVPISAKQKEALLKARIGSICKNRKPVEQLDLDNNLIKVYDYLSEVEKFGFSATTICKCCKNKQKTAYGYKWKYSERK